MDDTRFIASFEWQARLRMGIRGTVRTQEKRRDLSRAFRFLP